MCVLPSCGFDACEHEYASMSRHQRKVPVSFYHRFARDARSFSERYAKGRLISVLEGGYSDRALTSGAMAHLAGLVDNGDNGVDESWWSLENLLAVRPFGTIHATLLVLQRSCISTAGSRDEETTRRPRVPYWATSNVASTHARGLRFDRLLAHARPATSRARPCLGQNPARAQAAEQQRATKPRDVSRQKARLREVRGGARPAQRCRGHRVVGVGRERPHGLFGRACAREARGRRCSGTEEVTAGHTEAGACPGGPGLRTQDAYRWQALRFCTTTYGMRRFFRFYAAMRRVAVLFLFASLREVVMMSRVVVNGRKFHAYCRCMM